VFSGACMLTTTCLFETEKNLGMLKRVLIAGLGVARCFQVPIIMAKFKLPNRDTVYATLRFVLRYKLAW